MVLHENISLVQIEQANRNINKSLTSTLNNLANLIKQTICSLLEFVHHYDMIVWLLFPL